MSTETARAPLEITVKATLDGWPLDLHLSLPAEKVPAALARLREYGYEPQRGAAPAAPAAPRPKVEPVYQPDGTACCPTHKRALAEGRYGLYCPARAAEGDVANQKGYCGLKFAA